MAIYEIEDFNPLINLGIVYNLFSLNFFAPEGDSHIVSDCNSENSDNSKNNQYWYRMEFCISKRIVLEPIEGAGSKYDSVFMIPKIAN
jgi:hypothetical protein